MLGFWKRASSQKAILARSNPFMAKAGTGSVTAARTKCRIAYGKESARGNTHSRDCPRRCGRRKRNGPTRIWLSANIHLPAPGIFPKGIVMISFELTKVEGKKSVRKF